MLISPKDILIAAAKVGVHLARQERIFRDVRSAGIFVEWEEKQPDDADEDAENG